MCKSILSKLAMVAMVIATLFFSCTEKKKDPKVVTTEKPDVKTFENLHAPQTGGQGQPEGGTFTLFSFSKNKVVEDDSWDIAFRGTTILVNGGAQIGITDEPKRTGNAAVSILTNTLDAVSKVPESSKFIQDAANTYAIPKGSGNGWYSYNPTTHIISPIAGKILVVRTHDGKYAKMEILSYYKDTPAQPDIKTSLARYFTFKYVYQPNGNTF